MAGPNKPDKWYEKHGVRPPERIVHPGSDEIKPDIHTHKWEQRGNYLHCAAGQNEHGMPFDHLRFKLEGTSSKGAPIMGLIKIANEKESSVYLESLSSKVDIAPGYDIIEDKAPTEPK